MIHAAILASFLASLLLPAASASSALWAYEDAYDNVADGDWYRDYNDDYAPYLNGVESYVMMSLVSMYRTTGDLRYLDRLIWHADGVLAQRNDARGVTDFTGESTPCWRDMYYTGGRPFCWVLHSGVIIEPMIAFAVEVQQDGLGEELAYDGLSYADKAAEYVARAEETVAYHDVEWHEMGTYIVRGDATFLGTEAGAPYPLNCSNAMGRALLLLHDATGEAAYLEKATALAEYFRSNLVLMSWGGYAWTYYGDDLLENGEDISHAGLNVRFAISAWEHGIVFDDEDMDRFAATLLDRVAIDDRAFYNSLAGDEEFLYDYDSQLYNWLPLSARDGRVWTTVYNIFSLSYPAETLTGGSVLEGWALLAAYAPPWCAPVLPEEDWEDPDPAGEEDQRLALVGSPRVRPTPSGLACALPVQVDSAGALTVSAGGEEIARWQATEGELLRMIPVDPALGEELSLTSEGGPLRLRERPPRVAPTLTVEPTVRAHVGEPIALLPSAAGDETLWWSISGAPVGARVDPATGAVDWTPSAAGYATFSLVASNDAGADAARVLVCVDLPCPEEDTADSGPVDSGGADSAAPEEESDTCEPAEASKPTEGGCGCGSSRAGGLAWVLGLLGLAARRRRALALVALTGCRAPPPPPVGLAECDTGTPAETAENADTGEGHSAPDTSGDTADDTTGDTTSGDTGETGETGETAVVPRVAVDLSAGQVHTCALLDDGSALCWGSDDDGQLDAPAVALEQIDAGWYHTCGVSEGLAVCWGEDAWGQSSPPSFPMVAASAAYLHGAGITDAGDAAVWGAGGYPVSTAPDASGLVSLSCGQYHCCALDGEGAATCWGHPPYGITSPPDERFTQLDAGALHTCGVREDGGVSCWGYDNTGQTLPPEGEVFTRLACGVVHCCGVREDGGMSCWGGDDAGQSTPPDESFVDVTAGGYHSCGLHADGSVSCWGNDAQGQASVPAALGG